MKQGMGKVKAAVLCSVDWMCSGKKHLSALLLLAGLAILAYFLAQSNLVGQYGILLAIDIPLFICAFILSIGSIFLKVIRWRFLSRMYGSGLSLYDASLASIPSLFFANITPGKAGDLYKAYFMKRRHFLPYVDGVSMIFYERVSELSLLFITATLFLLVSTDASVIIILEIALCILVALFVLYWKADAVLGRLKGLLIRLPFSGDEAGGVQRIRKLSFVPLAMVVCLTFFSLAFEFIRLWVVILALGYSLPLPDAAIYLSLAVIAGLVSQIPLGVGVTEGSLDYLLRTAGLDPAGSMAIVLTDRMISMYFALILGFGFSKLALDTMEHPNR